MKTLHGITETVSFCSLRTCSGYVGLLVVSTLCACFDDKFLLGNPSGFRARPEKWPRTADLATALMFDWFAPPPLEEHATGAPPVDHEETARPTMSGSISSHSRPSDGPSAESLAAVARIMAATNPRVVLRLPADQTPPPAMIKRAYKAACLEVHPDRCRAPGAEDAFKRVGAAFDALVKGGPWESATIAKQAPGRSHRGYGKGRHGKGSAPKYWDAPKAAPRGQKPANLYGHEPEKPTFRKGVPHLPKKAGPPPRPSPAIPPQPPPRPTSAVSAQPKLDAYVDPMEV